MIYQKLNTFQLPKNFRGRNPIIVQFWWLIQGTLFRMSPQFMYGFRRFLLRLFGAKIGKKVIIRPSVKITYPWKLSIGDYSWIGDQVDLYTLGNIIIGKNVVISQKSYLCTGSHDYLKEDFSIFQKPITIQDQVWVASDVFIAPGITIGEGSIVAARSSVFKDIPSNKICAGSPVKIIRERIRE
jgi:putative colanic acid biosynthesis acetyltransferase WcaF